MKFELKHTFDAPVDAVMDAMSDPAFPDFMKSHMKLMSDIKPIDRKEEGGRLVVAAALRAGADDQEGRARRKCRPRRWRSCRSRRSIAPPSASTSRTWPSIRKVLKHLENSGSFSFRDVGGRTERTITGELKVTNLPFLLKPLGGIAERIIYSNAEDLLNEEAKVFGEFLKTRKPAA